jgi:hypothetical protein
VVGELAFDAVGCCDGDACCENNWAAEKMQIRTKDILFMRLTFRWKTIKTYPAVQIPFS